MGLINQRLLDSYLKATADSTCPHHNALMQGGSRAGKCGLAHGWGWFRLTIYPVGRGRLQWFRQSRMSLRRFFESAARKTWPTHSRLEGGVFPSAGFQKKSGRFSTGNHCRLFVSEGMIFMDTWGSGCVCTGRRQRPQAIECSRHALPKYCNSNAASCRRRRVDKAVSDTLEDSQSDQSLIEGSMG
ncbi:hypothetical protein EVAR_91112_1 [Eumeta japonica]|uniref:Uncharacterized protein n=1 Tax=Eumeta variegata TaxID=151549 RepID=A0A4C1SQ12_EUMVA|nr:hypothetical protein EVAR_91112_1 [Eumeta japonica]